MRKLLTLIIFFSIFLNAQSYQKEWNEIENLEKKELSSNRFYIDEKEAFGSINSFISYKFKNVNRAILIYQKLLKVYKKDKNSTELSRTNFKRLEFVYRHFRPKNRDRYYITALKSLASQHMNFGANYYLAKYYFDKLEYKKALKYAQKGIKNSDKNIIAKSQNIIDKIKSKYVGMDVERVNLPHQNILSKIVYKNIDKVFIKVVNSSNTKVIKDINISLPSSDDYKKHSIEISLGSYDLGEYIFVISKDKLFQKGLISKSITISNLAFFYKNSELLIVNRDSGVPIKGAKVIFYKDNSNGIITTIKSDKNGLVQIPKTLDKYYIQIEYGKDKLIVQDIMNYIKVEKDREKSVEKAYFFTDKDIYKPNDNINFKAILVKKFSNREPKVIQNRKIVVRLFSNSRKIGDKIVQSDEFGAIYDSFHIPKDVIGEIKLSSKFGSRTITVQKSDTNSSSIKITKSRDKLITMSIDKELDKNSAKVIKLNSTKPVRGKVVIEKLKPLKRVYRKRYWSRPDKVIYNQKEFQQLFPSYRYSKNRERKIIKTISFNTQKSKEILLENLEQGEYKLTLYTHDKYGTKIQQSKDIIVYDINQKQPPYQTYLWHKLDKNSYSVGSTATLYIKSYEPHTKVCFNLIRNNKTLKEEWIDINGSTKKLIPITKDDRGDIFYSLTMMKDSRKYIEYGVIKVPWDSGLKVEYISFRDKLKPNIKEQWKIKVTNKSGEKVDAQMVASIYQSSNSSISHHFDIENLYPKHYIGRYSMWDSYQIKSSTIDTKKSNISNITFFKPNLQTDKDGDIIIDFKTDNSLNHWKFLGFIHTKDLKTAITQKEFITEKELIVTSNLPKFFREDDTITVSEKIINRSNKDLNGTCQIKLTNSITGADIYPDKNFTKRFKVKKNSITTIDFTIKIPKQKSIDTINYTAIVKTDEYSDKQMSIIPIFHQEVITKNRVLYIKPKEKKTFILQELKDSKLTQKNYKLTIEFTSNPSWFALQAMPYILEYPDKSSQEVFNKYFVNNIASKLIDISPKIEKIFTNWRDEQDKKVAKIFNSKKLIENRDLYCHMIQKLQNSDGGWSMVKGDKSDWDTTQYIVKGFTKLKEIGIDRTDTKTMSLAIKFMDKQILKEYQKLKESNRLKRDNLNSAIIDYLYIRTFYDFPILSKEAYLYYLNQIKKYWSNKSLYEQATIALTLNKKLAKEDAIRILKSIKDKDIKYNQFSIETYTQIMKLFDTVAKDKKSVDFMKLWLLKNRKDNHWDTTKSTINAIYTLLWDNAWIINRNRVVYINFPKTDIDYKPIIQEAKTHIHKGIGYFKVSFDKFDKQMAIVEIDNPNNSAVWGNFSWQYLKK